MDLATIESPLERAGLSADVLAVARLSRRRQELDNLGTATQSDGVSLVSAEHLLTPHAQLAGVASEPRLVALGASGAHLVVQCRVAPRDVDALVAREGDHVGELLCPATLVDERLVDGVLARIDVQPALVRLGVHLTPHVVAPVEHVARVVAERARQQRKAVGPLAASAAPRLQQLARVVVAREACERPTRTTACATLVDLDGVRQPHAFGNDRQRSALCRRTHLSVARAAHTRRLIDPCEELLLEPGDQLEQHEVGQRVANTHLLLLRLLLATVVERVELLLGVGA